MKLRCRPEGRPGTYLVDVDDVRAYAAWWFETNDDVHTIKFAGPIHVGCDVTRDEFDQRLAVELEPDDIGWGVVLDPDNSVNGHHLVLAYGYGPPEVFDFGIRTVDDLDIGPADPPASVTVNVAGDAWMFEGRASACLEWATQKLAEYQ